MSKLEKTRLLQCIIPPQPLLAKVSPHYWILQFLCHVYGLKYSEYILFLTKHILCQNFHIPNQAHNMQKLGIIPQNLHRWILHHRAQHREQSPYEPIHRYAIFRYEKLTHSFKIENQCTWCS